MKDIKQIEEFVDACCRNFSLSYDEFFSYYDDEAGEMKEKLLAVDGELDMSVVRELAKIFGCTVDCILNADDSLIFDRLDKYPYFSHRPPFECARESKWYDRDEYYQMRILEVLFGEKIIPDYSTRYDINDVCKRMIVLLKEYDKILPGTWHKGETLNDVSIETEAFCHFDEEELTEMVQSYFELYDRAGELFFKAWETELSEKEIREYDFLVSVLGLQDAAYRTQEYLYYDLLKTLIPVYQEEGYERFDAYVRIKRDRIFALWECAEFVENEELVQKYIDRFPETKGLMRTYAQDVMSFNCNFYWSDANRDDEIREFYRNLGIELMEEELPFVREAIRVPKTEEEFAGDDIYAKKLEAMTRSESAGGLRQPDNWRAIRFAQMERMCKRASAVHDAKAGGGND